jgi:hypothetical protein
MDTMTRLSRHRVHAAVAALVLAAGLAACGDDEPTAQDPGGDETTSVAGDPSDSPTSEPTDEGSETAEPPAGTVTVPVYFVGETPQGPALYREFRKVEADNPMEEAMALATSGDALDPDYGTLYPGGTFESVSFSEGAGAIVAQVKDEGWNAPGDLSKDEARLAVQQLVYTVQGIQGERLPVLVQLGNDPVPLFGVDTGGGLTAAKPLDVLAFMNVTTPEEGATVSGAFTAEGVGSSFEATVLWEVRDGSGTAVLEGFTTAEGWMDKLYPWTAEVDVSGLAPGTYTFVAMTDDPSGGEGFGPTEDTKTIVVP